MNREVRASDLLYFLAELAVYVAVAWWGMTRDAPGAIRWLLGLGGVVAFAMAWAVFAAPRAAVPLHGLADAAFRVTWFGLGPEFRS